MERPPVLAPPIRLGRSERAVPRHRDGSSARLSGEDERTADPVGAVRTGLTSSGFTLDPILALQVSVDIEPGASVRLAFITAVSGSRESVLELAERYQTMNAVDWVIAEAEAEAGRELQRFGIEPSQMAEMQTLGVAAGLSSSRRCAARPRRSRPTVSASRGCGGWDSPVICPILLVKLRTSDDIDLLRDVARAHAFWGRRGLRFDLVVLRHGASGYEEPVGEKLRALLHGLGTSEQLGQPAGIHVLSADHIGEDERRLLDVVANVVLDTDRGHAGLTTRARP